jgi:hypothetical protein
MRFAMACPKCGGSSRRQVAPGAFECTSVVTTMRLLPAPGPGHGPVDLEPRAVDQVCGHRYQEGTPAMAANLPKCWCGVFAIAECTECGSALCGDHIQRAGGRVYCKDHVGAARSERAAQAQSSATETLSGKLRAAMAGIGDPVERVLSLAASTASDRTLRRLSWGRDAQLLEVFRPFLGDNQPAARDAFGIDVRALKLEITDPAAFAAWAFRHPGAEHEKIIVRKFNKIIPGSHVVATEDALRITKDSQTQDFDARYPTTNPGTMLLRTGVLSTSAHSERSIKYERTRKPERIHGERLTEVVAALLIPGLYHLPYWRTR